LLNIDALTRAPGGAPSHAPLGVGATQQVAQQRRQRTASWTHAQLDKFEESLNSEQEAMYRAYDDLPEEAGLRTQRLTRMMQSGTEDSFRPRSNQMTQSEPNLHSSSQGFAKKPPSPLQFYDYGCVSLKPRSLFAQHRHQMRESARAAHRQTSCGFYSPGSHPHYGFSMMDPHLLPASIKTSESPKAPTRWIGDACDVRPLAAESIHRKQRVDNSQVISPQVRTTIGHTLRARHAFHALDKQREESVLEQARFESGVYDGKWRDPLLDSKKALSPPSANHDWVTLPRVEMSDLQREALHILLALDSAVRRSKGSMSHLFAAENSGAKGVLEPDEFLRGLRRIGIIPDGAYTANGAIDQVISTIDRAYDGRVKLPLVARAIASWREKHPFTEELVEQKRRPRPVGPYGDKLQVLDTVKMDYKAGLYDFGKSFERFRTQQKELLSHHSEATMVSDP